MALQTGATATSSSPSDEKGASRLGVIEINDLVYKLEADLSVAVNKTHKTGFFQNNAYADGQTAIAIFNSGADYIDPRRSFLSFTVDVPPNNPGSTDPTDPLYYAVLSYYFGPNGSVLNLIDSVLITSRSGDELSRINDYGTLMYTWIPWTFGKEWADTIGQEIGLGSYIGGFNTNGIESIVPMPRTRFQVPLYLLSPFFTYGRLMPSMVMSGLRVEIKWKPLDQATQQFWENTPLHRTLTPWFGVREHGIAPFDPLPAEDYAPGFNTRALRFLRGGGANETRAVEIGRYTESGLDPLITTACTWDYVITAPVNGTGTIECKGAHTSFLSTLADGRQYWLPGDSIGFFSRGVNDMVVNMGTVINVPSADQLTVTLLNCAAFAGTTDVNLGAVGTSLGMFRMTGSPRPDIMQRNFNSFFWGNRVKTPSVAMTTYNILDPQFSLSSVQLSDAVQRHLNEYSAVNGLEIVFADWDRTSAPVEGKSVAVYTEVRKSASRALQIFSVVCSAMPSPQQRVSFASVPGGNWVTYQYQLGSLYFPQQQARDSNADPGTNSDNMKTLAYAYAADAFDRLHPKAAPALISLRGRGIDWRDSNIIPFETYAERDPDTYLVPNDVSGKNGSFANGAMCVATSLERSTMFDLSGVPINNSRVLAIRGTYLLPDGLDKATIFCFLKYVRLLRAFLINVEVEQ